MLKRGALSAGFALVLLVFPSVAGADAIEGDELFTYDSNAPGADPHGPFICGETNSFTLPKFDDTVKVFAFGQWRQRELVAVTVNVIGAARDGYILLDSEDPGEANAVLLTIGARLRVTSDTEPAPLVVITFPHDSNSGTMQPDSDGGADFTGSDSIAAVADGDTDANHATIDVAGDPGKQAPWVGAGEYVTWNFDANSHLFAEIRPAVEPEGLLQSPTYHLVAEVRYHWQVMPEPLTGVVVGIGGVAMLLRRRRRRTAHC